MWLQARPSTASFMVLHVADRQDSHFPLQLTADVPHSNIPPTGSLLDFFQAGSHFPTVDLYFCSETRPQSVAQAGLKFKMPLPPGSQAWLTVDTMNARCHVCFSWLYYLLVVSRALGQDCLLCVKQPQEGVTANKNRGWTMS